MGSLLLVYLVTLARAVAARELTPDTVQIAPRSSSVTNGDTDREHLDLCDCRPAGGDPEGLSCDAEGYVVVGFERHGVYWVDAFAAPLLSLSSPASHVLLGIINRLLGQWVVGGNPVPLSRAICCKPCRKGDKTQDDVVVSLGCHASSDPISSFRCEQSEADEEAASFAVGFTSASRVFAPGKPAYYPSDAIECCSPSLVRSSGELTGLEPCDCIQSSSEVSCGGEDDGRALVGFDEERIAPSGHYVPVGAARCCRMCVGGGKQMDCAALDHCSGRGACILGSCACMDGWSGASCKIREAGGGDVPAWAIAVIVVGSCLLGVLTIGSLAYMCELFIEAREARLREGGGGDEDEDAPTRPLLIHLDRDDDGSVGSQDTTDEEDEEAEITGRIAAAERDLNAGGTDETDEGGESHAGGGESDCEEDAARVDGHSVGRAEEACGGEASGATEEHPNVCPSEGESDEEDIERIKERLKRGHGPLAGVLCGVCLDRPVQVCVIPCGHVCMCRRCSRRVRRCPVCRSVVGRRQKLFV